MRYVREGDFLGVIFGGLGILLLLAMVVVPVALLSWSEEEPGKVQVIPQGQKTAETFQVGELYEIDGAVYKLTDDDREVSNRYQGKDYVIRLRFERSIKR